MHRKTLRRRLFANLFVITLISLTLVGLLSQMRTIQNWLSKASGRPAIIIVDTQGVLGPLTKPWQNIAQGGESPDFTFDSIKPQLQTLSPQYVRLDHIFDYYVSVDRGPDGRLQENWQHLDSLIASLTSIGAKPFLSLSYMPPAISSGGLTDPPRSWNDWQTLVQDTIIHVSSPRGLNIKDAYYEVWNEPDLFGQWKTYGAKNYLDLYRYAAQGAAVAATQTNTFHFGGPATTALYDNWVTRFVDYVGQNNLRFDFFSYHEYSVNVDDYLQGYSRYIDLMRRYPQFILNVEPVISEWGIDSEMNPAYDNTISAAHTAATIATFYPRVPKLFTFELIDGKNPDGQEHWGRWGLLTNQAFGAHPKPRYQVLQFFNRLGPNQLSLIGNGTWVKGLAAQATSGVTQVILTNYDPEDKHVETVPVTFQRVTPGTYKLIQEFVGRPPQTFNFTTDTTSLKYSLPMPPNSVVLLTLTRS